MMQVKGKVHARPPSHSPSTMIDNYKRKHTLSVQEVGQGNVVCGLSVKLLTLVAAKILLSKSLHVGGHVELRHKIRVRISNY